ncbi:MAG: cysteine desulfurase family protein, partial [Opitutales bacterium]
MRFFDHNATTPLFPEAKAAWMEANEAHWFNPSSPYRAGAAAHAQLENARERLASLLSLAPTRIIFNSGATEGNNTVFATWAARLGKDSTVAVGMTEHPSVLEAAGRYFEGRIEWQEPSREGVTHPNASLAEDVSAISIMAANNETGVLNPWQDWIEFCRARGIPMHCDASQWIGKMPLDLLSGCDYVTGCAHKFGGPKGVGFLIVPEGEVLGFA